MKFPYDLLSENFINTHEIDQNREYPIYEIRARELLKPERIDLAAKLAYIESKVKNIDIEYAKEIYEKHLEAFSEGYFTEPGDENKNSLNKYFQVFDDLIDSMQQNGFDRNKSFIPIGRGQTILDGAHRTACAIYFDLTVTVIEFEEYSVNFGYQYFRKRNLSEEILKEMTLFYVQYAEKKLYCACLWPIIRDRGQKKAFEEIEITSRVLYSCKVDLQYKGLRNFMLQIYGHQEWVGTLENHYSGLPGKVDACYYPNENTMVVIFEAGDLDEVLRLKECIREQFQLGKHVLHISDSVGETKLMVNLLMNENSVHALNYGNPDKNIGFIPKLKMMPEYKLLSPEATLDYYGIKDCRFHLSEADTLNPRKYFVFENRKLSGLSETNEVYSDSQELRKLLNSTRVSEKSRERKAEYRRTRRLWRRKKNILKIKQVAAKISEKMGIYASLHKLFHIIKR